MYELTKAEHSALSELAMKWQNEILRSPKEQFEFLSNFRMRSRFLEERIGHLPTKLPRSLAETQPRALTSRPGSLTTGIL